MSRYVYDFSINKPDDFVKFVTEDFFAKEGFTLQNYKNGEVVWSKGLGLATAPQFYKVSSLNGRVHLEAWMAVFALPGINLGETGIDGFWGWAVKSVMRERVNRLVGLLCQDIAVPAATGAAPQAPAVPQAAAAGAGPQPAAGAAAPQQPVPVMVHNPTNKATTSLVLGIVSMVAWLVPFFGILGSVICGLIAISTGRVGKTSTKKGMAQAGFILGIVGLAMGCMMFLLDIAIVFLFGAA